MAVRLNAPQPDIAEIAGAAEFDAVVSSWAEPVRCQSLHGCGRRARWVAIRHNPCGGHQSVCTLHYRKWLGAALIAIARSGRMRCEGCHESFRTVEQCMCFRPL